MESFDKSGECLLLSSFAMHIDLPSSEMNILALYLRLAMFYETTWIVLRLAVCEMTRLQLCPERRVANMTWNKIVY